MEYTPEFIFGEVPASQQINAIYTSETQGGIMISHAEILVTKKGLKGDRYETRTGYYSEKRIPDEDRGVTFISTEGLQLANNDLAKIGIKPFTFVETRRNISLDTELERLNTLIHKRFKFGDAIFEGTDPCTPCMRPGELTNRPINERQAFIKAFLNRGGIRAKVIYPGPIKIGSKMIPL